MTITDALSTGAKSLITTAYGKAKCFVTITQFSEAYTVDGGLSRSYTRTRAVLEVTEMENDLFDSYNRAYFTLTLKQFTQSKCSSPVPLIIRELNPVVSTDCSPGCLSCKDVFFCDTCGFLATLDS